MTSPFPIFMFFRTACRSQRPRRGGTISILSQEPQALWFPLFLERTWLISKHFPSPHINITDEPRLSFPEENIVWKRYRFWFFRKGHLTARSPSLRYRPLAPTPGLRFFFGEIHFHAWSSCPPGLHSSSRFPFRSVRRSNPRLMRHILSTAPSCLG